MDANGVVEVIELLGWYDNGGNNTCLSVWGLKCFIHACTYIRSVFDNHIKTIFSQYEYKLNECVYQVISVVLTHYINIYDL